MRRELGAKAAEPCLHIFRSLNVILFQTGCMDHIFVKSARRL